METEGPRVTDTLHRWALHATGIIVFMVIWEVAGNRAGEAILAPPSAVAGQLINMLTQSKVLLTIADSLYRMLIGYALALLVGIPIGITMGRSRIAGDLLFPWLSMLIVTSVASLVPLFILGVGTGAELRVLVVFVSCVFYITLVAYQGARDLNRGWIEVGQSFAASPLQKFTKIMLPALLPYLMIAARLGLGQALRGMILGEMFVVVAFGGLIQNAGLEISTATLLALLLILMTIALLLNALLQALTRSIAPWLRASETIL